MEMRQGKLGGESMVEHNVCDTGNKPMAGDSSNGDRKRVFQGSIDGNEGFRAPAKEHLTVVFNQILAMSVLRSEIKISCVHQVIPNSAQNLTVIAITQFGDQNSYGLCAARTKRECQKTWLVIQFFCDGLEAFTS